MLPQKPHVRFLEASPVQAVRGCSRPPDQISDIARIGVELKPHGAGHSFGSKSGSGERSQTIRGDQNEAELPRHETGSCETVLWPAVWVGGGPQDAYQPGKGKHCH